MIQGGDPMGQGFGGPGFTFDDEIHPELQYDRPYLLAMANAGKRMGKGTNGSQFFITVTPTPHLNGKHTIFGEVADQESRDVVDKIAAVRPARTIGRARTLSLRASHRGLRHDVRHADGLATEVAKTRT